MELVNEDENILVMSEGKYASIAFLFENDETYFNAYKKLFNAVKQPQSPVYEVYMPMNFSPTEMIEYIVELKVKII